MANFKIILAMIVFLLAFGLLSGVPLRFQSAADAGRSDMICRAQLVSASQGSKINFEACVFHTLIFEQRSAKAINPFENNLVKHEYNYESYLRKLKEIRPDLQNLEVKRDHVPEELVYFIIAEEFRECNSLYNIDALKIFAETRGSACENLNVCKTCAFIIFEDSFPGYGNYYANLSNFMIRTHMPYSAIRESYRHYLANEFDSEEDFFNVIIDTQQVSQLTFLYDFDHDERQNHIFPKSVRLYTSNERISNCNYELKFLSVYRDICLK